MFWSVAFIFVLQPTVRYAFYPFQGGDRRKDKHRHTQETKISQNNILLMSFTLTFSNFTSLKNKQNHWLQPTKLICNLYKHCHILKYIEFIVFLLYSRVMGIRQLMVETGLWVFWSKGRNKYSKRIIYNILMYAIWQTLP